MDGLTSNTPPSASSMSRSTQEHHHSSGPTPISSVDPPRPARDGYDRSATPPHGKGSPDLKIWRRRRRSRRSGSGGPDSEPYATSPKTYPPVPPIPAQTPQSPYLSEKAHVYSLQKPPDSSGSHAEQEGEWLAPKDRGVSPSLLTIVPTTEVKPDTGLARSRNSESSEQAPMEDGKFDVVKKYLDRLPEAEKPVPEEKNDMESNTKGRRVRFGRVLWHRRGTTRATDNSELNSTSHESKARASGPAIWLSQFPGGEATRVHTPPYKDHTADGRPRGLFFDVARPSSRHSQTASETSSTREKASTRTSRSSPSNSRSHDRIPKQRSSASGSSGRSVGGRISPYSIPGSPSPRKTQSSKVLMREKEKSRPLLETKPRKQAKEWWDVPPGTPDTPPSTSAQGTRSKRAPTGTAAMFKFDVPEHLPNSPMCPANPKNPKSLGKGVCVVSLHGLKYGGVRALLGQILCFLRALRGKARLMMMGTILCNAWVILARQVSKGAIFLFTSQSSIDFRRPYSSNRRIPPIFILYELFVGNKR
ncbi:hypothetical protein QBC36DRAFT_186885 [Triangularia setosa]|uniref:Uncharacterized protein n=1 Tax=Triangularia setosa TaxID=2587417 RepID=A0AAN6W7A8_9PEZI|nr:hypothetical protein QBC36DRAFT_186885 [Podospora setosa]